MLLVGGLGVRDNAAMNYSYFCRISISSLWLQPFNNCSIVMSLLSQRAFAYWVLIAVLLLGSPVSLHAASKTVDIYSVSVNVANDSPSERKSAAKKALDMVYQRATGNPKPLRAFSQLRSYLDNATRYLATYAYQNEGPSVAGSAEADSLSAVRDENDGSLRVVLQFDSVAIKQHLRESGAPFWAEQRPELEIVIMTLSEAGTPKMVQSSPGRSQLIAQTVVDYHAADLGLPSSSKLARSLNAAAIWALGDEDLRSKARRSDNPVLFGRVTVGNQLRAQWTFVWGDILYTEISSASRQGSLVRQGISIAQKQLASRLASRIDSPSIGGGRQSLTISGINSVERYSALVDHLDSVEVMRNYVIVGYSNNRVELELNTQASASSLRSMLRLDKRLVAQDASSLSYQWR